MGRSMEWFYAEADRPVGPLDDEEFRRHVRQGRVRAATPVWWMGAPGWYPFQWIRLQEIDPRSGFSGFCSGCSRALDEGEMIHAQNTWVCPECKPLLFQRVWEGPATMGDAGSSRCAGFLVRCVAGLLDLMVVWLILAVLAIWVIHMVSAAASGAAIALMIVFASIVGILYETVFVGKYGATPGKLACRVKVTVSNGSRVGYALAFGRCAAKFISTYIVLIGYVLAAFDAQKRTLHDRICDTRVVWK